MAKKEFLILGKRGCPYTIKIDKFMKSHNKSYSYRMYYVNVDFQEEEFKNTFGKNATYPRVFEIKTNGKKVFIGGADDSIEKLKI